MSMTGQTDYFTRRRARRKSAWVRAVAFAAAAAGLAWAAGEFTRMSGARLALEQDQAAAAAAGSEQPATPGSAPPSTEAEPIRQLSDEEIEAELRKAEAAVQGGKGSEAAEAEASKPLPADLAVPLPSDI